MSYFQLIEGSLKSNFRQYGEMKSRAGQRQREEKDQKREEQKRKSKKKEDGDARKGRKVAIHYVFPMICGSGGSKSRLAKAAGAEPAGQRDEKLHAVVARRNCTPLWREAHFQVKMYKAHHVRTTFGSWDVEKCTPLWREAHFQVKMLKTLGARTTFGTWDVEKVHAVVARSTFRSQNVQNTPLSDHFWELRCWRSARRCGAKHISKSKC